MTANLTDHEVLDRFAGINVWKRGGERAPHKPLLILDALARLQRGEPRLTPFRGASKSHCGNFSVDFGPPRKSFHPEYPFWHLQSDGIWDHPPDRGTQGGPRTTFATRTTHQSRCWCGRQARKVDFRMICLSYLRLRVRNSSIGSPNRSSKTSGSRRIYEDILDAVGLPWVTVARKARARPGVPQHHSPHLRARCAVCGYDGMLGNTDLGIEAAHVRWHAAGGSDTEDNGIALCSFHHKVFDRGAIGFDNTRRILISQHVRGSERIQELLLRHFGAQLRPPQSGQPVPAPLNIRWHRKEVFREPARTE